MKADLEPLYADIGRRVHDLRVRNGLTQEQLGARLTPRMTRASIANIETGKQRFLVHTLVQLAQALDVGPERLLGGPPAHAIVPPVEPLHRIEQELKQYKLPPKAVRAVTKELRFTAERRRR